MTRLASTTQRGVSRSVTGLAIILLISGCVQIGTAQIRVAADWTPLYEPNVYEGMPYRLMKPIDFDESTRYPLIVSLHGGGGKGTDNRKQLKDWNRQLAEEQRRTDFPCYVLAPQANDLWNGEHLKKIQAIIKDLPAVDMDRIYILGHSMGNRSHLGEE